MIDFTEMEYGFIKTKKGVVIVMNGSFYGPFNKKQYEKVMEMLEEMEGK